MSQDTPSGAVTQLLDDLRHGTEGARTALVNEVYCTLRHVASRQLAQERPGHTLTPTGLVNEAYIRLLEGQPQFEHRRHFFGAAAQAMRRILVDHARSRLAAKRGCGVVPVTLGEDIPGVGQPSPEETLVVDQLIDQLGVEDELAFEIARLRLYAGLEFNEIAELLECSTRTVMRRWRTARAWLGARLQDTDSEPV